MVNAMEEANSIEAVISVVRSNITTTTEDDPIMECGDSILSIMQPHSQEIMDLSRDKLHTWPFKDVPLCWRRAYEDAALWHLIALLDDHNRLATVKKRTHDGKPKPTTRAHVDAEVLAQAVSIMDMIIILTGAPARRPVIHQALRLLSDWMNYNPGMRIHHASAPTTFPHITLKARIQNTISTASHNSLEHFQAHLHSHGGPLIFDKEITHWPACTHWKDPQYLLDATHDGTRLVPVELGRSYTDADWTQRIMPFHAFLTTHLLRTGPDSDSATGYLAQHDLLSQIPSLAADTLTPDLCYAVPPPPAAGAGADVESLDEPIRNAWFGPGGTISPLHTDPYHNILAQVVGRKYIRLYAPGETPMLYARGVDEAGISMENTSLVDVNFARQLYEGDKGGSGVDDGSDEPQDMDADARRRDLEAQFPLFKEAKFVECVLEAGQCLYIPVGWWHYVQSLEVSFNVSYWFN